jgi:hypothetical protein
VHDQPVSTLHELSHPSPLAVLPSSHVSFPETITSSPHTGLQVEVSPEHDHPSSI